MFYLYNQERVAQINVKDKVVACNLNSNNFIVFDSNIIEYKTYKISFTINIYYKNLELYNSF